MFVASLFSKVTAAVTNKDSGNEVKLLFDNFVKDLQGIKFRK
jgi:hypothetical protein